jgi:uncharacterized RDD family membrane protein YckC
MPSPKNIDLTQATSPSLLRRLAAICYDAVLVFGVLLLLWTLFYFALSAVTGQEDISQHPLTQLYWPLALVAMIGFHVWFWIHGGQTLGMKSWRVRVVAEDGGRPSFRQALIRYLFAWVSAAALGLGFLWVLFDPEQQTWHDRVSGTRLLMTVKRGKKPGLADPS